MTMASAPPTEEERRLLREYRLTTVPSRRSSCSPATSNASSSTTNNLSDQQLQQPHIIAATNLATTVKHPDSGSSVNQNNSQSSSPTNNTNGSASNQTLSHHTNNSNNHHHHHHHKHHGHHHHNHSNHRRHKSTTPTHELTADELNRMVELVSELSYLKLVSPSSITITNGNDDDLNGNARVMKPKNPNDDENQSTKKEIHSVTNGSSKNDHMIYCSMDTSATTKCKPYIFEKVDYIKKISIRRKAFKKLKKARIRSRVTSPNTSSESLKLKL